jgi:hypothetical protein
MDRGEEVSDKELLELAAKACALPECGWMGPAFMYVKDNTFTDWNPLEDDGDALRLAVKLEIAINPFAGKTVVAHNESGRLGHEKWDCWDDDPYAASRRAIVRIAAAIGRAMP